MSTIAKAVFTSVSATEIHFDALKTITMFCAAGLVVSVLPPSYGAELTSF